MVDWWVDLWAVIHGWPTVILLIGPGHPCRWSANGCQCKCYGRIIQIHALVPFLVKCTCISHTCVYILCTYSIRAHIYKIYTLFIWSGIDGRIIIEQIYGTHTPYSPSIHFFLDKLKGRPIQTYRIHSTMELHMSGSLNIASLWNQPLPTSAQDVESKNWNVSKPI